MDRILTTLLSILFFSYPYSANAQDTWKHRVVPTGLLLSGVGITTVWTMELLCERSVDMTKGFFSARDRQTKQLLWPHVIAEYATAAALIVGAVGLYREKEWGRTVTLISTGALAYTSLSSLSWTFSEEGRMMYAIPMICGLAFAGVTLVMLF